MARVCVIGPLFFVRNRTCRTAASMFRLEFSGEIHPVYRELVKLNHKSLNAKGRTLRHASDHKSEREPARGKPLRTYEDT